MKKKIVSSSDFKFILLLALVVFSFQSCLSPRNRSIKEWEQYEWKIVKEDKKDAPTWVIYKRKIAGTNLLEYKIEGNIKTSSKASIISSREGIHNQANKSKNEEYPTYEIIDESKDSLLTYVIHDESFLFRDTEMCVRYRFFYDEDGNTIVKWNEAWDECAIQPSKKLKRVETFRGSWVFSPTSNNSCKSVNTVQFDLKGMPLWLAEPMVIKFLKGGLEDKRKLISK